VRTLGVEEELLLVDADTFAPVAVAGTLIRVAADKGMELTAELQQQQIEIDTAPTRDLGELVDQLKAGRRTASGLAASAWAPGRRPSDSWRVMRGT
jgi:glutamate---cysteine ligase / carboxylate-amine ligase